MYIRDLVDGILDAATNYLGKELSSAFPDEWQEQSVKTGDRPDAPPLPGFKAAGPWKPFGTLPSPDPGGHSPDYIAWMRPLRKDDSAATE